MQRIRTYFPGIVIFVIFLIGGLLIYQDYGASIDEIAQNEIGKVSYNYVFRNDPRLNTFIERDHGVGFELPLVMIENALKIDNVRDLLLMRHLVTYLFFIFCMFSGYMLAYKLFKNQVIACMVFVMLVLNPRLFAHSFINSKDIPAMGAFLLSLVAAAWAFDKKKIIPYIVLGIVCGYSVSIRLMNIIIFAPIGIFFLIDIISGRRSRNIMLRTAGGGILCLSVFLLSLYTFWPTLWAHPIDSLLATYKSLSHFRWNGGVLLGGIIYITNNLPGAYIPTWFLITVPEIWILSGLYGIAFCIVYLLKQPFIYLENTLQRNFILYLFCFLVPILLIIKLEAVVYDDWRHMYFIYPSFILLAAYGLSELFKTKYAYLYKIAWVLQLLVVLRFTIKYHPYQYAYFNNTVSHKKDELMKNYELDYWGCSFKDGLEWILANDGRDTIKINKDWMVDLNYQMLTPDKQKRFVLTGNEMEMDYHLENFRTWPYKYPAEKSAYQIFVSYSPILRITKLH